MKSLTYLLLLLCLYSNHIHSMYKNLTPEESACFTWFQEQFRNIPSPLHELHPEDQAVFNKGLRYTDHPEEVMRSRSNLVSAFYAELRKANISILYPEETLQPVALKVAKTMQAKTIQKPTSDSRIIS